MMESGCVAIEHSMEHGLKDSNRSEEADAELPLLARSGLNWDDLVEEKGRQPSYPFRLLPGKGRTLRRHVRSPEAFILSQVQTCPLNSDGGQRTSLGSAARPTRYLGLRHSHTRSPTLLFYAFFERSTLVDNISQAPSRTSNNQSTIWPLRHYCVRVHQWTGRLLIQYI